MLIVLTVQGWTGDTVTCFSVFPSGPVASFGGFSEALLGAGPILFLDALEGGFC